MANDVAKNRERENINREKVMSRQKQERKKNKTSFYLDTSVPYPRYRPT